MAEEKSEDEKTKKTQRKKLSQVDNEFRFCFGPKFIVHSRSFNGFCARATVKAQEANIKNVKLRQ